MRARATIPIDVLACKLSFRCLFSDCHVLMGNSISCGLSVLAFTSIIATLTGSRNLLGPALPGLRNMTPLRVSTEGW